MLKMTSSIDAIDSLKLLICAQTLIHFMYEFTLKQQKQQQLHSIHLLNVIAIPINRFTWSCEMKIVLFLESANNFVTFFIFTICFFCISSKFSNELLREIFLIVFSFFTSTSIEWLISFIACFRQRKSHADVNP